MRSPISTTVSFTPRAASASMMMQPMKPAPICSTRAPGLRQRHDLARVGERPARVHALHVDARDRRPDRRRAGRDAAGGRTRRRSRRRAAPCARARRPTSPARSRSSMRCRGEVVLVLAQVGAPPRRSGPSAGTVSPCANTAARARRRSARWCRPGRVLADRLRRDDAGGAVAEDDVSQVGLHRECGRSARNRPCAALAAPPAGSLTARGGSGSPSSAVPRRPSRAARSTRAASCRDR